MSKRPLEEWPIENLKPYENNAKIHTKQQIAKIAKSIEKHGLVNPPNVEPDGTIISGHGRLIALKQLGWKTVPVFVRHDLTKAEAAATRIADNKVAEGDVDTNLLQEELRWLETESLGDLTDLGFEDRELSFLTEDIGELDTELLDVDSSSELDMEESTEEEIAKAEESKVALVKAMGFKEISMSESRTLARFLAHIRDKTGFDDPREALMDHAKEILDA